MGKEHRDSGIDIIGRVPWGTHFCQFYDTGQDLLDILVPYFQAGLESNEACMWVTAGPVNVQDAREALGKAVPDLDRYLGNGQLEIIPYQEWYMLGGVFDLDRVLNGWVDRLDRAVAKGFSGLRLTGNTAWLERKDWQSFAEYEEAVDRVLGRYRMIALCTYCAGLCGVSEVADVISNHQFALMRRSGRWEIIESAQRKRAEQERERLLELTKQQNEELQAQNEELRAQAEEIHAQEEELAAQNEELRQNEEKFRLIANTYPGTIFIQDNGLRYTYVTHSLHYSDPAGSRGMTDFDLYPEDQARELALVKRAVLESGKGTYAEFQLTVKGDSRWFGCGLEPWRDAAGKIIGVLGYSRDITDQKLAEEERERLLLEVEAKRQQAEEAVKLRDVFLSVASHELKTPLTSLLGYAQLMQRSMQREGTVDPQRLQHVLEVIGQQSDKLARLINQLLDVSRIESGKFIIERKSTDLAGLVESAVSNARARTARHIIQANAPARLEASVDPLRLEQVLGNLLDNAIKFSPEGSVIEVEVHALDEQNARIAVRDRGIGIPPERRADLFSRFYQAHQSGYSGGMGLGLFISKQIVELHGGTIAAEFPEDGGTRFVVELPKSEQRTL
ncbi:MAG: MEDS domain-containing protein [Chloroflexi bacterium]|nr:MEDS domain-containing protein [Chloroflexota bacterium]